MGVFRLVHQKLDIKVEIDPQRDEKGIWGTTKLYFVYIEGSTDKDSNGKKSTSQYIPIHCRQIDIDTDKVTINGEVTNLRVIRTNVERK